MTAPSPISADDLLLSIPLNADWEMLSSAEPQTPGALNKFAFHPAQAPGTIASSRRKNGTWQMGAGVSFDASEHWFRCRFDSSPAERGEEVILRFGGIATIAEVWLNGEKILTSDSMFASHDVDVTASIQYRNELLIVCRSLTRVLKRKRGEKPVTRWKTRVVAEQQLRWFRTTLLGRAPGFACEPEPVGPWRPVTILRRRQIVLEDWTRDVSLDGSSGVIRTQLRVRTLDPLGKPISGKLIVGDSAAALEFDESDGTYRARATIRIPDVNLWMPHTHGEPSLYPLRVELQLKDGSIANFEDVPVGFRSLDAGVEVPGDQGLALKINGIPIFCRGVVWTPPDVVSLSASQEVVRDRLQLLRDAGFNLIRLAGTTIYEDETFHSLCDELGLLVWQDMMFANMDYPYENADFRDTVRSEAQAELSRLGRHPSTAVICGNSEIEQQAGMLGLPAQTGRGPWFGEDLPRIAAQHCPGVPYVPSAPCGGELAFRTRAGISNYFGVGAYLRPFEDVRRAEVKFASECLAFANIPEPEAIEKMALATPGGISPTHPVWKRGVPRDAGASWDFEDVRDHYLKLLHSVDPAALRYSECNRYWELSRMVSGEVMAEVFGEWRRAASPCSGGIVLWAADIEPGAGWGILDSQGSPKSAYWFLKRALAPRSVWTTDEGLNGIDVHLANDSPSQMDGLLRIALYRGDKRVAQSEVAISVPRHQTVTYSLENILGRFVDAAYAYRFGPAGHDVAVVSLHNDPSDVPFAQSFRFPGGYPAERVAISELGFSGDAHELPDGKIEVLLSSRRLAWGVRIAVPGFMMDDAYFNIEPGGQRRIVMSPLQSGGLPTSLGVTAMNAEGRIAVAIGRRA